MRKIFFLYKNNNRFQRKPHDFKASSDRIESRGFFDILARVVRRGARATADHRVLGGRAFGLAHAAASHHERAEALREVRRQVA